MKILYFIRHAKSSWDDVSLDDHDRPLNKRGQHDGPVTAPYNNPTLPTNHTFYITLLPVSAKKQTPPCFGAPRPKQKYMLPRRNTKSTPSKTPKVPTHWIKNWSLALFSGPKLT